MGIRAGISDMDEALLVKGARGQAVILALADKGRWCSLVNGK